MHAKREDSIPVEPIWGGEGSFPLGLAGEGNLPVALSEVPGGEESCKLQPADEFFNLRHWVGVELQDLVELSEVVAEPMGPVRFGD